MESKRRLILGAALAALVALAVIGFFRSRRPTPADVARRGLESCFDGDLRSAVRYIDPVERSASGLDDEGIVRVFREYIGPRFRRIKRLGSVAVEVNAPTGTADAIMDIVLPEGKRTAFTASAVLTPDDPRFDALMSSAIVTAATVDHSRGDERDVRKHILKCLTAELPELRRLGLKGIETGGKAIPLADFLADIRQRIDERPLASR